MEHLKFYEKPVKLDRVSCFIAIFGALYLIFATGRDILSGEFVFTLDSPSDFLQISIWFIGIWVTKHLISELMIDFNYYGVKHNEYTPPF